MTARKTLTTKKPELPITEQEKKYLERAEKILSLLKPGEVVTIEGDGKFRFDMATAGENFTIDEYDGERHCGTAGCIAGLMHLMTQVDGVKMFRVCRYGSIEGTYSPALRQLFYPHGNDTYYRIKPKTAAYSIRYFLKTGKYLSTEQLYAWQENNG